MTNHPHLFNGRITRVVLAEFEVYPDGTQEWLLDGVFHRTDGPAISYPSGFQAWFRNGLVHRLDGPAITFPNGYLAWYIHGRFIASEPPPQ